MVVVVVNDMSLVCESDPEIKVVELDDDNVELTAELSVELGFELAAELEMGCAEL